MRALIVLLCVLACPTAFASPEQCASDLRAGEAFSQEQAAMIQTAVGLLRDLVNPWTTTQSFLDWAKQGRLQQIPLGELGTAGPVLLEALQQLPWGSPDGPNAGTPGWGAALEALHKESHHLATQKTRALTPYPEFEEIPIPKLLPGKSGAPISALQLDAASGALRIAGINPDPSLQNAFIWFAKLESPWRGTWESSLLQIDVRTLKQKFNLFARLFRSSITPDVKKIALPPQDSRGWAAIESERLRWVDTKGTSHFYKLKGRKIHGLRYSSDGQTLYVFSRAWDNREFLCSVLGFRLGHSRPVFDTRIPGDFKVHFGNEDSFILGNNTRNGSILFLTQPDTKVPRSLYAVHPDGKIETLRELTESQTGWDLRPVYALDADSRHFFIGRKISVSHFEHTLSILSTTGSDGDIEISLPASHFGPILAADFSADGRFFATLEQAGSVHVWDWKAQTLVYRRQLLPVGVRFSPNQLSHLRWGPRTELGLRTILAFGSSSSNQEHAWVIRLPTGSAP